MRILSLAALTAVTLTGTALESAAAAVADASPAPATVTVVGQGTARATPDEAVLSLGVEVAKPTADAATAAAAQAADAMLAALRAQGVADQDITTTGLNLNADSATDANGVTRITGYTAGQSFDAVVRAPGRAGAVVAAATGAAGDAARVSGIAFDLADHRPVRATARDAAVADARAEAEQYARDSGHVLGRVVSFTEGGTASGPHPMPFPVAAAAAPLRVAPGQVEEQVSVTAVYELD